MTLAIDAILIFAAVLCIWTGARRGFVRTVMGTVSTLVSFIAAYAFTPVLSGWIAERFLRQGITEGVREKFHSISLDPATDLFNFDSLLQSLKDRFDSLPKQYHVPLPAVAGEMEGITGADEAALDRLAERFSSYAVDALSTVIAFAVLFLAASVVMLLLTVVIDLMFRLPVLKSANIFFGALVGVFEAIVLVSGLALIFNALIRYLGVYDPTLFGDAVMDNTLLCSFFVNHNIFSFLRDGAAGDFILETLFTGAV